MYQLLNEVRKANFITFKRIYIWPAFMEWKKNERKRKEKKTKRRKEDGDPSERGLMDVTSQHRGGLTSRPPPLGKAKNKTIVNIMAEIKINTLDRYLVVITTLWHRYRKTLQCGSDSQTFGTFLRHAH